MEGLPGNAIARGYLNGTNLMDSVRQLAAVAADKDGLSLEALTAAVVPEREGVLLTASVKTPGGGDGTSYEPKLLDRVPADAAAALSFGGTQKAFDLLREGANLEDITKAAEEATGVSFDRLTDLFSGEGMLYLRAGTAIPEVTVVLAPPDLDEAYASVDTLVGTIAKSMDAEVKEVDQDGVTVRKLDAGPVNVSYARLDDAVILTTGASGIRLFREDGDKLGGAEGFTQAAAKVGLGDLTSRLPLRRPRRPRAARRGRRRRRRHDRSRRGPRRARGVRLGHPHGDVRRGRPHDDERLPRHERLARIFRQA